MKNEILRLIASPPDHHCDTEFNALALRLFRHQYHHNLPYRQFCNSKNVDPVSIKSWNAIPPLPVTAFKWADVTCKPKETALRVFHSSGTTRQEKSRHYLFNEEIAEAAIFSHFKRHILPDCERMRMMILTPSPEEAPHASLSYMMDVLKKRFGEKDSRFFINNNVLQSEALLDDLSQLNEPVAILGTSFSFVHFFDDCLKKAIRLNLPPRSRLMDTGGFKGKSREVSQDWLYGTAGELFNISPEYCVNEYGMSEMHSQFYDGIAGRNAPRCYIAPPQLRTKVLSPETLTPVLDGEMGILAHFDLANIHSVSALLTEDLGRRVGQGFVFLERASAAEEKGCSLTLDTLLLDGA